jgi:hypothetical protein
MPLALRACVGVQEVEMTLRFPPKNTQKTPAKHNVWQKHHKERTSKHCPSAKYRRKIKLRTMYKKPGKFSA